MEYLTFGGHKMEFEVVGKEVFITCKKVTGTLSEVLAFKAKKNKGVIYSFGKTKIKRVNKDFIQVGCLIDSKNKVTEIVEHCNKLKNG